MGGLILELIDEAVSRKEKFNGIYWIV